jgi:hypothetical protein
VYPFFSLNQAVIVTLSPERRLGKFFEEIKDGLIITR